MRHTIPNVTTAAELAQTKKIIRGKTLYPAIAGVTYRCPQCRCLINVSGHAPMCAREARYRLTSLLLSAIPALPDGMNVKVIGSFTIRKVTT